MIFTTVRHFKVTKKSYTSQDYPFVLSIIASLSMAFFIAILASYFRLEIFNYSICHCFYKTPYVSIWHSLMTDPERLVIFTHCTATIGHLNTHFYYNIALSFSLIFFTSLNTSNAKSKSLSPCT